MFDPFATEVFSSIQLLTSIIFVVSGVNTPVPIIYDADISHKGPSMTIINGAIAEVQSKKGKGNIKLELL